MIFPTGGTNKVYCVQYVYEHFAGGSVTMVDDKSECLLAYGMQGNLIDVDTTITAEGTRTMALIARDTFLTITGCTITFSGGNSDLKLSIGFYISGAVDLIDATVVGSGTIVKYYEN